MHVYTCHRCNRPLALFYYVRGLFDGKMNHLQKVYKEQRISSGFIV